MNNIRLSIKDKKPINLKLENPVIEIEPKLENLEINPSKEEQTFKSKDYYGYNNVTINPVTNSIDENIKSENIKKDVSILGVTGNVEEINTTEISINPTETEQVITPEAPYNGFSKVTVGAQSGIDPAEYFETTITSSNYNYFIDKYLLKKIPTITIASNVTSLSNSFYNTQVSELKIAGDTSNVTNMSYMFHSCSKLTTIPQLDTSNVTNMSVMFYGCSNLTTIPQLDTSNVTNMSSMFHSCSKLTTIPQLDTSNVTNMSSMFYYCSKLTTIPQLDTSNVTSTGSMFYNCSNLTTIPQLDTSRVTNVNYMFYGCSKLINLGGLENLGQAYLTTASSNNSNYTLNLSICNKLTHESLMNVINNLYDIATAGVQPQKLQLGSTNLAKLTDEEKNLATSKGWSLS